MALWRFAVAWDGKVAESVIVVQRAETVGPLGPAGHSMPAGRGRASRFGIQIRNPLAGHDVPGNRH